MEIKICPLLIFVLLFTLNQVKEVYGSCCESKVVGDKTYILLSEDNTKTSELGCIDGCIYRHEEDESATPSQICFKEGKQESMCTEEPVNFSGCIGPDDKLPIYWVPFLKDPCNYTFGLYDAPNCPCPCCTEEHSTVQNIGIVGAGMAGLTMAWILQYIGHNVTLIEATDRVGGRAFTHYGSFETDSGHHDWYGDLGAMRFPPKEDQPLTYQLFEQFKIPLQNFTNTNEGTSYYYVNGKYFSSEDLANNDQSVLKEVYETFGIPTNGRNGKFPKLKSGTLQNPSMNLLLHHYFPKNSTGDCKLDDSVENVLKKILKKAKLPLELIHLWSVLELARAFLPFSAYQFLADTPVEHQKNAKIGDQFKEVVNGTSVLPEAILKTLTNVDIRYNSSVKQVTIQDDNVTTIKYTKDNQMKEETFDKVVLTPTSRVVSFMKFSPPLPYDKTYALNSFYFMNSVKVFLAFTTPFWATDNKVRKIPFDSTSKTNGGSGITDLPIRSLYYPSHPNHGNSILVSYVWGADANRLSSLSDEDLIQESLANLVEIHGSNASDTFKEGKVQKWLEEDWTAGAFAWAYPGQMQTMEEDLRAPHGLPGKPPRVFFAGEYTSKFDHGWIQAAVESACRVSYDMFKFNGVNKGQC